MAGRPRSATVLGVVALSAAIAAGCEQPAASRVTPAIPTSPSANATKTFSVAGIVVDAASTGHPISGARVQIVGSVRAISDDRGAFALSGVAAGRTFLEVTK